MDLCIPSLTCAHLHTYTCIHTSHRHMHTWAAMHAQSHIRVCANILPLSCTHALTFAHTFYNGDIHCESREGQKGRSNMGRVRVASAPSIPSLDLKRSLIGLCDLNFSFQGEVSNWSFGVPWKCAYFYIHVT